MKEFIKWLKRGIKGLFNYIAWNRQYKAILSEPRKSNFVLFKDWYAGHKILMMVPHADDELISSYSVLSNASDLTVYYCGFTGSNCTEANRQTRQKEILRLCSEMGVKIIEGNGTCENLESTLCEGIYDSILLPSVVDWHNEHRKISYMISDVCLRLKITPDIYCYSVTVPNETQREVLCVPLTEEQLQRKYEIFKKIYLSQKVMPIVRMKLNDRINGYHSGSYASECFLKYTGFNSWLNSVEKIKIFDNEKDACLMGLINGLKTNLNNLVSIREVSKKYYCLLETE